MWSQTFGPICFLNFKHEKKNVVDTQVFGYWHILNFFTGALTSSCIVPCQSLFAIAIIYAPLVDWKRKVRQLSLELKNENTTGQKQKHHL